MTRQHGMTIAQLTQLADELRGHKPAASQIEVSTLGKTRLRNQSPALKPEPALSLLLGIPVVIDETVPPDRAVFRDDNGDVLAVVILPAAVSKEQP